MNTQDHVTALEEKMLLYRSKATALQEKLTGIADDTELTDRDRQKKIDNIASRLKAFTTLLEATRIDLLIVKDRLKKETDSSSTSGSLINSPNPDNMQTTATDTTTAVNSSTNVRIPPNMPTYKRGL
jgi:hypothetical protein